MSRIASHLIPFRRRKLLSDVQILGWMGLLVLAVGTVLLVSLEALFWFPVSVRYGFWRAVAALAPLTVISGVVVYLMIRRNRLPRYSLSRLAGEVGETGFDKRDQVTNALQLEETVFSPYPTSPELAQEFVTQIASRLERLNPARVITNRRLPAFRKAALVASALSMVLWIAFFPRFSQAAKHWIYPRTGFPVPLPFELVSRTGNLSLMGGDTATVVLEAVGAYPDSIYLEVTGDEGTHVTAVPSSNDGSFVHTLPRVLQNIRYRGFVPSRHFWQPWDEISSPTYEIHVLDRPSIHDFVVTIHPPAYAGMEPMSQRENIAEIRALKGSALRVDLTADKTLSRAYLSVRTAQDPDKELVVPMEVDDRVGRAEMTVEEEGTFETHIFDLKGTGNLDPIQYRFVVIEDSWPLLEVLDPSSPVELGSDFSIPVRLHVEDDFGFSDIQIVYEARKPEYAVQNVSPSGDRGPPDEVHMERIGTFDPDETSQDLFYLWDVSSLGLMPEDEVRFHFEVYDNDDVSGPKKSISETLIARFPSLADLYARTESRQEGILEETREMAEDLKELDRTLEEVELELLKENRVQWEQEQTLKRSRSDLKEKLDRIDELQRKVQEIIDESEKHTLFSPELVEKFRHLQDLLQEIMTPELMESLEKMGKAMEDISAEQLLEALKDFRMNTALLEEQLDRFIDIFERIRAEQSMDELVSRTEALVHRQESLVRKLERTESGDDISTLAEEQRRNRQELENILDLMDRASRSMEPFARMPAGELARLAESELSESASSDLNVASRQLTQGRLEAGTQRSRSGRDNLRQLHEELGKIRDAFQQETVTEMMAKFQDVLNNTLFISKTQEALRDETLDLPRNSPRLGITAARQHQLRDQLGQLTRALVQLSRETFAVTPEMGKAIGRATAHMNESLRLLEERNGKGSARNQEETVAALNQAAIATVAAMTELEQSGMASGMEQFLERMQKLAGAQQGINEQTLQLALGQMEALAQEQLMRRLTRDQERIRKSLSELIREMRGRREGGEALEGIAEDMDNVIRDFRAGNVDRRTVERQQRILSRMLDSQRSIRKRDFSEKRKSTVARDIAREGPSGLPPELGQRRNLAMEALNLALRAGYPREYQEMLRRYFNTLMESPELDDQKR